MKTETLNLNTFGSEQCQKWKCDLVQIFCKVEMVQTLKYVTALTFLSICMPPSATIRPQHYVQLQGLDLADYCETDGTDSIDILVGLDYYWDIVTGEVVRGDGLITICSKFGCLVSGPVNCKTHPILSSLALQDQYSMPTQGNRDELLDHLQQFWSTESLEITEQSSGDKEFEEL